MHCAATSNGSNLIRSHHYGLETGAAHLVDGGCGGGHGNADGVRDVVVQAFQPARSSSFHIFGSVAQAFLPVVGQTFLSVDVRLSGGTFLSLPKPHMRALEERQKRPSGRLGGRERPHSPAR